MHTEHNEYLSKERKTKIYNISDIKISARPISTRYYTSALESGKPRSQMRQPNRSTQRQYDCVTRRCNDQHRPSSHPFSLSWISVNSLAILTFFDWDLIWNIEFGILLLLFNGYKPRTPNRCLIHFKRPSHLHAWKFRTTEGFKHICALQ